MSGTPQKPEYDDKIVKANFSAMLYLITEQQALIGKLLQAFLDSGLLTSHQLGTITDPNAGEDGLTPTYTNVYNRFAQYYVKAKEILDDGNALERAAHEALRKSEDRGKDKNNE